MEHNFIKNALAGFIADYDRMIKPFSDIVGQSVPVYIENTGDEVYLTNMKDTDKNSNIYKSSPRIVFAMAGSFNIEPDQLSSPFVMAKFDETVAGINETYRANVRRIPITIPIEGQARFDNMFQMLQFIEIMLIRSIGNNTYSFNFAGYQHFASYDFIKSFSPEGNNSLGFDGERRGFSMNIPIELQAQYLAYDIYDSKSKIKDSTVMNKIVHNIDTPEHGNTVATQTIKTPNF